MGDGRIYRVSAPIRQFVQAGSFLKIGEADTNSADFFIPAGANVNRFVSAFGSTIGAMTLSIGLASMVAAEDVSLSAQRTPSAERTTSASGLIEGMTLDPAPGEIIEQNIWSADRPASWLDHFTFLAALSGSKQPQDLGVNAQLGARFAANLGVPLQRQWGLSLQVGTSIDPMYQAAAVLDALGISDDRLQNFTTVGVYQRRERGLVWGVVHDFLYENYYGDFLLGQWRGNVAWNVGDNDEIGTWFAIADMNETATVGGFDVLLRGINQGSIYWRHWYQNLVRTTLWVGAADGHGAFVLAVPNDNNVSQRVLFGADIRVPLTSWAAIFGEANLIAPFDSGTVDAYLGIEIYPRQNVADAAKSRYAPLFQVASNPTFAVNLRRR